MDGELFELVLGDLVGMNVVPPWLDMKKGLCR